MQYGKFASIYDILMAEVDRAAWASYVLKLLEQPSLYVVDCACGTGELTIPLAKAGHKVVGQDISTEMLEIASNKARAERVAIPFVRADMRNITTHRKADAIVSACDGANYLTSASNLAAFFTSAYNALKPGGKLLFDVSSYYKLKNVLGNNTFTHTESEAAYIWQNIFDEETSLLEMELTFFKKTGTLYERFEETHVQRAHTLDEIISILKKTGFSNIKSFEAFTFEIPSETTERIQFVATK